MRYRVCVIRSNSVCSPLRSAKAKTASTHITFAFNIPRPHTARNWFLYGSGSGGGGVALFSYLLLTFYFALALFVFFFLLLFASFCALHSWNIRRLRAPLDFAFCSLAQAALCSQIFNSMCVCNCATCLFWHCTTLPFTSWDLCIFF